MEAHQLSSGASYNPCDFYRCDDSLDETKFRQGNGNCPKIRHELKIQTEDKYIRSNRACINLIFALHLKNDQGVAKNIDEKRT